MEYPRVTEILRLYSNIDQIPKEILENAAARGTSVHALCAAISKGEWIPDSMISEDLVGYVASFRKWMAAQIKKFVIVEKRFTDEDFKFSGQIDSVAQGNDDELYLIDLKTSSRSQKTYPIQMAAYSHLLSKHQVKINGAMLVYLDKDGEFPDIDLLGELEEEFQVFLSALTCWHYFNKGKRKYVRKDRNVDPIDNASTATSENCA